MPERAPKILGTGLVALDLVVSADPNTPVGAWAGGTCANVMSILAWLGWDAYPIARMDGDAAAIRVKADLQRCGVKVDLTDCEPAASTPIVVQQIKRTPAGFATHKFSWSCLRCGGWLPSFKPVTRAVIERVTPYLAGSAVFFLDRVSRAALDLAAHAADDGAVVMFEPSGRGDEKLFAEALQLAHIVKYSDQRLTALCSGSAAGNLVLEVQTLGSNGLRFRLPRNRRNPQWRTMPATPAPSVVDSCGSGDWCTAGLLSGLATEGIDRLQGATVQTVKNALGVGQQLAAWNCAFEGARGGMYSAATGGPTAVTSPDLPPQSGHLGRAVTTNTTALINCPRCDAA